MIVSRTRFETTQHDSLIHMMLFGLDYLVVQRTTTTTTFYCCMDLLIASFGSGNEFFFWQLNLGVFHIRSIMCLFAKLCSTSTDTMFESGVTALGRFVILK